MNLVYHLERAVAAVGDSGPDGKWLIIVDFNGYSMFNAPPLESTRHTIKILQVRATHLDLHCRLSPHLGACSLALAGFLSLLRVHCDSFGRITTRSGCTRR